MHRALRGLRMVRDAEERAVDDLALYRDAHSKRLSVRDVNRDDLPDLGFSVEKSNPNLGLAALSTTLVVRGAVPTSSGATVLRGNTTMGVSP